MLIGTGRGWCADVSGTKAHEFPAELQSTEKVSYQFSEVIFRNSWKTNIEAV